MTKWQSSEAMIVETNPLTMLLLKLLVLLSCAAVQARLSQRAAAWGCSSHIDSRLLPWQGVSTMFAFPFSACRPKDVFIQLNSKYFNNTNTLSVKINTLKENGFDGATCSSWACEQRNCTALAATTFFKPFFCTETYSYLQVFKSFVWN